MRAICDVKSLGSVLGRLAWGGRGGDVEGMHVLGVTLYLRELEMLRVGSFTFVAFITRYMPNACSICAVL